MYGYKDTLSATLEMMCMHTTAVAKGASNKFLIADLPFMSYRKSLNASVETVSKLMQSGANAVKLEGVSGNIDLIHHLVESGVPVMGHIGLTPQFLHILGGYKVQGKTPESKNLLLEQAVQLQQAGCFAIVLECIPAELAKSITNQLEIATIGIGAGSHTSGQVLVYQDLLGFNKDFKPKFVKHFIDGYKATVEGVEKYINEINSGEFLI